MLKKLVLILFSSFLVILTGCQSYEGENVNGQKEPFEYTIKGESENWVISGSLSGIYYNIEEKLGAEMDIVVTYKGDGSIGDEAEIQIENYTLREDLNIDENNEVEIEEDIFIDLKKQIYADIKEDELIATITWGEEIEDIVLNKSEK